MSSVRVHGLHREESAHASALLSCLSRDCHAPALDGPVAVWWSASLHTAPLQYGVGVVVVGVAAVVVRVAAVRTWLMRVLSKCKLGNSAT